MTTVRLTREIFAQKAFDEYRGQEVIPGPEYESDKAIGEWIKETCETIYHPCCSNKMGKVRETEEELETEKAFLGKRSHGSG